MNGIRSGPGSGSISCGRFTYNLTPETSITILVTECLPPRTSSLFYSFDRTAQYSNAEETIKRVICYEADKDKQEVVIEEVNEDRSHDLEFARVPWRHPPQTTVLRRKHFVSVTMAQYECVKSVNTRRSSCERD